MLPTFVKTLLHTVSILGNSPSSIRNSLTQKYFYLLSTQRYTCLCCSIHHNTLILKTIQNQHGTFFQPIVPPFNTYFNWDIFIWINDNTIGVTYYNQYFVITAYRNTSLVFLKLLKDLSYCYPIIIWIILV